VSYPFPLAAELNADLGLTLLQISQRWSRNSKETPTLLSISLSTTLDSSLETVDPTTIINRIVSFAPSPPLYTCNRH